MSSNASNLFFFFQATSFSSLVASQNCYTQKQTALTSGLLKMGPYFRERRRNHANKEAKFASIHWHILQSYTQQKLLPDTH